MNPTDPFNPIKSQPVAAPPKPPGHNPTQGAAEDVARAQISQIFGADGHPNDTLSHSNQPMIRQDPVAKQQTSHPTTKPAEDQHHNPDSETHKKHTQYHAAWQDYYRNYYERYYISAMEQQKQNFAHKQASVQDKSADDGTMTQREAIEDLRGDLLKKISSNAAKARKSRHFIPALSALSVILIAMFIQYNSILLAQVSAFVSPASSTSQDVIIGTGADQAVSAEPRIIIPKINVNAPIVYGLTDLSENSSEDALQNGVVHYPIMGASATPGQKGNTVLLGHSSADFFKPGNFKFIFVQLNRLSTGDLFYLDYQSKRYTYRISKTEVINPDQVSKLAIGEDKPYATLVTCDPPGTAQKRLVIYADQISPDPSSAATTQDNGGSTVDGEIVGNPPTLFEQIFGK